MGAHEVDLSWMFSLACIIVYFTFFFILFFIITLCFGTDPACLCSSHLYFIFLIKNHLYFFII